MNRQPIYDNKNLKKAGKYNFENVNSINRRMGQMEFDHTIETTKENKYKPVIITSIISAILLIAAFLFAFTDLKYLFIPKPVIEEENTDFEALDIIHELNCSYSAEQNGVKITIDRTFEYNNNKIKKATIETTVLTTNETLINDSTFHDYMIKAYKDFINTYKGIDGIETYYENEGHSYKSVQIIDLKTLNENGTIVNDLDVYYDQNIDHIKKTMEYDGSVCKKGT